MKHKIDETTLNALGAQERKQNEKMRFDKFKELMEEDWNLTATEDAWAIMEAHSIEKWDDLLEERVTRKMDKGDIPWIIDQYHKCD